jgi:predicted ferric reductase
MDSYRRRLAGYEPVMASSTLEENMAPHVVRAEADPTSTISPYYQQLNGVNQPMNMVFKDALWWMLGLAALTVLAIRIIEILWAHMRHISAMSAPRDKQAYWKLAQWSWMPPLKKHLMYAPLFRKRHNREIRLSKAGHMGTLPSRLFFLIILVYSISNIVYMFVLDWKPENKWAFFAELRGRSGTLGMVNMIPLIILAGRNNPLIGLLQISFDNYNLLHRWLGRICVIEIILHTVAWAVVVVADGGWPLVGKLLSTDIFVASGMVGTVVMVLIMILSLSPIRHAFYETFLNGHIFLALVCFVCTLIHCLTPHLPHKLPQLPWIIAIFAIWIGDRLARVFRLLYVNWSSKGFTDAICEPMPGEVTRVTLRLPRHLDIKPGTHAYLRFSGVNAWESHPFSIAWVQHLYKNTLPITEKENVSALDRTHCTTEVSFVIGAQSGMTRKLYNKVKGVPRGICIKAAMEGPYAGHHSLDSYGHVVLFAGATGITHQISYIRHLLEGYNEGTVATRRVTLVWVIREYESLEWVRPYMDTILRIPNRKDILRIQVFVTRPQNPRDIVSASNTVKMFPGRPNVPLTLVKEVQEQVGSMCVTVCGPGALADDVRAAVRAVQADTVVDFIEESFTW